MKWEPVDIIVLILVVVTGVLLMFGEVKSLIITSGQEASAETIKFIGHAIGAYIAIISMYVGSRISKKNDKDES